MSNYKFNRVFLIILDSAGVGEEPDAALFDDVGTNTFAHAAESINGLNVPYMESMGLGELDDIMGVKVVKDHPHSFSLRLRETSLGKDTMTGHWEMMGINTKKPFQTFTDTGFSQELIDKLEKLMGHRIIGNISASGTEIIKQLGEESMRDNSLIVYTSSDSVLQIAANEDVLGLNELYRCCEIAREVCMEPKYFVGRVIARPFRGTNASNFVRDGAARHDYTVSPTALTALEILKDNGLEVSGVGKINDIFNGVGITRTIHTAKNVEGMDETIRQVKEEDYKGLCFINLVEFDSEYGHRRNPVGYARALEEFDEKLGELLKVIKDDDLIMISADHGNDPIYKGTDHTREKVPLLIYSKSITNGKYLEERPTFADIGATILKNFHLDHSSLDLGSPIEEVLS